MTDATTRLEGLVDRLESRLAQVPELNDYSDWPKVKAATAEIVDEFARDDGARYRETGSEHVFRMAGFSASSTSSQLGALRNWCAGARRRLGRDG
ncbi:hypothetical protein HW532_18395 [Kaustia mangrovi]|uniref:Uncharacterized protein n=1 Tax=Kaustia mangrovi TaxID=2593653 RepID=A0A7S8C6X7_9HYPH|nr:hypothetical protein [Kaustia mangrovi]QPC44492.1 hypothetical protein HW532_18395 [Kaustia mangrovi]